MVVKLKCLSETLKNLIQIWHGEAITEVIMKSEGPKVKSPLIQTQKEQKAFSSILQSECHVHIYTRYNNPTKNIYAH